jgi:hypothetical protein
MQMILNFCQRSPVHKTGLRYFLSTVKGGVIKSIFVRRITPFKLHIVKIFIEKAQVIHNVTYETPYLSFKILTFKRIDVPQDLPYVPFLNLTMS